MNREQLELVTAYIDGEASTDERALVESDPALLAEADRLRSLRAAMHDVEPPSPGAKEQAIVAALTVFDDLTPAGGSGAPARDVTAPANVVPFERRQRARRMQGLAAAAAAVIVVVGGAVIATRGGGDDGGTADNVRVEVTKPVERDQNAAPPAPAFATTTGGPDLMMAAEPTPALADTADAAPEAADAELEDEALTAETEGGDGDLGSPTSQQAAAAPVAPTTPARLVVIASDDDLTDFIEGMKEPPVDAQDAADECVAGVLKADATFEDVEGRLHPVVVVFVDDDTVGVLTLDECEIALRADR